MLYLLKDVFCCVKCGKEFEVSDDDLDILLDRDGDSSGVCKKCKNCGRRNEIYVKKLTLELDIRED